MSDEKTDPFASFPDTDPAPVSHDVHAREFAGLVGHLLDSHLAPLAEAVKSLGITVDLALAEMRAHNRHIAELYAEVDTIKTRLARLEQLAHHHEGE